MPDVLKKLHPPMLLAPVNISSQFHDGLGFLTSHSLLTNTFEFSLQQVNPKLTVPYWDFTIESSTTGGAHPEHLESQDLSPMFDSSWFGSHDPTDMQVKICVQMRVVSTPVHG